MLSSVNIKGAGDPGQPCRRAICLIQGIRSLSECKGSRQMRLKIASDRLLKMKPDVTATRERASYRQEGRKRMRDKLARREPDSSQGKKKRIKEEVKKENMSSRCIETRARSARVVNKTRLQYIINCCRLLNLHQRV